MNQARLKLLKSIWNFYDWDLKAANQPQEIIVTQLEKRI